MSIYKVNNNLPRQTQLNLLNNMVIEVNGKVSSGKFDINEIAQIVSDVGVDRKFVRNESLGNTVSTYTNWSHVRAETGYSIWKIAPDNYTYNSVNQLFFDDKLLDNRGQAGSESSTSFDSVFLHNLDSGAGFTDNTTEAGTEGGTEFEVMDSTNDYLYVGDASTFTGISFEWETRGSNYTLVLEYYNGSSWTALSANTNNLSDNTSNFESNGRITWTAPDDWSTTTINSASRYWIRISTSSTPVTTAEAYSIVPYNSVPALLALSNDEILDEDWAWCSYGSYIYVTIRNTSSSSTEGNYFINSSSSTANLQNFFIYNHEYKADYEDSTYEDDELTLSLDDLSDVDFDSGTPTDNMLIVYDSLTSLWKAETLDGRIIPFSQSGFSATNINDAIEELLTMENLWDRTGTTLSQHYANDNLDFGSGNLTTTGVITGDGSGITNIDGQNIPFSHSGFTAVNLNDAIEEILTQENLWDRVGTTLYPHYRNDNINIGSGTITVGNTGLIVGSSTPFSDSSGTLTLQNVDSIDSTTETTIETAIDSLVNLTVLGSSTGLVKVTSGTLSYITDSSSNWDLAYIHISSSGSDHTYIDQSVVIGSSPTLNGQNITNIDGQNIPFSQSGFSATNLNDAVEELMTQENLWDRSGTVLSPKQPNDSINIGTGIFTGNGSGITNIDGQNIPFSQSGFSATNLNDAVEELMTQENLWNRVGTVLSPKQSNDSINIGTGIFTGNGSGITNIDGQNIPFSQSGFSATNLNDAVEELMTIENLWDRSGTTMSPHYPNDNLIVGDNISIGDDTTDNHKIIYARNGEANYPNLRYNESTNKWQFSNNGTTWSDIGTGSSGANTSLSNLSDVAVNTALISDTDNTDDLGSSTKRWKNLYVAGTLTGDGNAITNINGKNIPFSQSGFSALNLNDAVEELLSLENLFDRVGTTLYPHYLNDNLDLGTGSFTAGSITDGTFSVTGGVITGATNTNWDAAYSHMSASGTSHTYIDQDVTSGSSPTFNGQNITNINGQNIPFSQSGFNATNLNDAVEELMSEENLWNRTDTTLSPKQPNDSVNIGSGDFYGNQIILGQDATAGTPNTAGIIKLFSAGDNAFYTTFTAATQTANATYTLPTALPAISGYTLVCTDAGVMSWTALAGGGDLKSDGSVPLSNNWNAGNYTITSAYFSGDGANITNINGQNIPFSQSGFGALNLNDAVEEIQSELEVKLENIAEDSTPQLGGELNAGYNSIGFSQQTAIGDGTTTIDWKLGNKFKFTFGAQSETFTFTAPSNVCNLILVLVQDATGSRTATWPASVKWPGGTAPTLTTTGSAIDIVAFYYDGSTYYGQSALAFATPS